MKEGARNFILKELVERKGFSPLTDNNGNILRLNYIDILQKQSWGATFIIELLDGDYISEDEIEKRLEHGFNAIKSMEGYYPVTLIEAFVFEKEIPEGKRRLIENLQEKMQWHKRYVASFALELGAGQVIRFTDPPVDLNGLYELFEQAVTVDKSSWTEQRYNPELPGDHYVEMNTEPKVQLSDKKPFVSYVLIAANVLMWLFTYYYSKAHNVDANFLFGEKFNPLIMKGQYWRLLTPVFLHGGLIHLMINSYSIYAVGPTVERLFGPVKFTAIYFAAGIAGNVASFIFSIHPSVGASGAIFGLMGALLYMGQKHRTLFKRTFGRDVIFTILFNIVYGFSRSGIDNYAHIGGLFGGYLAALGVGLVWENGVNKVRMVSWAAYLILIIGGVYAGFKMPANIELQKAYDLFINSVR